MRINVVRFRLHPSLSFHQAMVLRRFDFEVDDDFTKSYSVPYDGLTFDQGHPVGMRTGATIHTRNGLHLKIKRRQLD